MDVRYGVIYVVPGVLCCCLYCSLSCIVQLSNKKVLPFAMNCGKYQPIECFQTNLVLKKCLSAVVVVIDLLCGKGPLSEALMVRA